MILQGNTPANTVLSTIDTGKVTGKTLYETVNNAAKDLENSTFVEGANQLVLEPQSVTFLMVTTNVHGLLLFEPDSKLAAHRCSPAHGEEETLPNLPFFILVTNTFTGAQNVYKHELSRRLRHDICKI